MKKVLVSMFVMALMLTTSALAAQEVEAALEAQAAETVEATVEEASAPVEEVTPVADAQASVSDGVALDQAGVPVTPVASDVIFDAGVVVGGGCFGCEQPVQAFAPASCCNPTPSCCGCDQSSFVQPVVFNQPIFDESVISQSVPAIQASSSSIVNPAPAPASVYSQPAISQPIYSQPAAAVSQPIYSQPATAGCSSCSGGGVVNYAPAATSYTPAATTFSATPATTSFAGTPVTSAPIASSYTPAPVASSFVSSPSVGCSSCGQAVPTATCCPQQSRGLLRSGGLFRRGVSSRLRGAAIGEIIEN